MSVVILVLYLWLFNHWSLRVHSGSVEMRNRCSIHDDSVRWKGVCEEWFSKEVPRFHWVIGGERYGRQWLLYGVLSPEDWVISASEGDHHLWRELLYAKQACAVQPSPSWDSGCGGQFLQSGWGTYYGSCFLCHEVSFVEDDHHWRLLPSLHILWAVGLWLWCFVIVDCDRLQSVSFTSKRLGSFRYTKELCLKSCSFLHLWPSDLPSLERISIGPKCFRRTKKVVFESSIFLVCWWIDLASLKSIELGTEVFCGGDYLQASLGYYPYKYDSSLVMKSNEWRENDNQISLFLKQWRSGIIVLFVSIVLSWLVSLEYMGDE